MPERVIGVAASRGRRQPDRRNSIGKATRERIIITAERLFAQRGIGGPSLEEIGLTTGQRNKTVVHYYFGDRDGLVRAIIEHRAASTNGMRARMLADMIAEGRQPDVRSLVSIIVLPVAEQLVPDNHYVGFLAQLTLERGPFHPGDELTTVSEALRRLVPDLPPEIFDLRFALALDTNILTLAHIQRQGARRQSTVPLDLRVADLIEVISGVFTAPAPIAP
jgi:AcrR family transcriptional regulator